LGLSREQLAELAGYKTPQSIAQIESGQTDVSLSKLRVIAKALKTTESALMSVSDYDGNCSNDNLHILADRMRKNGYEVAVFSTSSDAVTHIMRKCKGKSVGFIESVSITQMGLVKALQENNKDVFASDSNHSRSRETARRAITADVFINSPNAVAFDSGEMVNVSYSGSKISGSLYYADEIIFVIGKNKIAPDLKSAMYRAKNVYPPQFALKNNYHVPCAMTLKCEDCDMPDRICHFTCIYHRAEKMVRSIVILVDEELGY
jgi:transcriptional regulator with XRE-family HTH domain